MRNLLSLITTLVMLLAVTTISVLYTDGWRITNPFGTPSSTDNQSTSFITKTGMLAVRSIPDGAKAFLNGDPITATNDTIASLSPKSYTLTVEKEGYEKWSKQINVYSELVTDITAVLISQTPKLEALTSTEVKAFVFSYDNNDVLFITPDKQDPGIWTLPLSSGALNILRNSSKPVITDTNVFSPSVATQLWWSWDRKEILVELNPKGYLLYKLDSGFLNSTFGNNLSTPEQLTDKDATLNRWNTDFHVNYEQELINTIFNRIEMPEVISKNIKTSKITWSPDETKFTIEVPNTEDPSLVDIYVYNGETPLPIDEKRLNLTLSKVNTLVTSYSWYTDSFHLILLNKINPDLKNYAISMIRIDGTNLTPVYTGYLATNQAYSTPYGDKIVVMTSLKEGASNNLYGIAIR